MIRYRLIALALVLLTACTKVYNEGARSSPSPTAPSSPTASRVTIQFRVTGNASGVRVRYASAADGLTQVVTTLPFVTSATTTEASVFLSLEATPTGYSFLTAYPFLAVQIVVDGQLFREASANDAILNTLAVSGTWRR